MQTGFFSCIIKITDFTDNRNFSCEYIWDIRGAAMPQNARVLIRKLERDELLEELVKDYLDRNE